MSSREVTGPAAAHGGPPVAESVFAAATSTVPATRRHRAARRSPPQAPAAARLRAEFRPVIELEDPARLPRPRRPSRRRPPAAEAEPGRAAALTGLADAAAAVGMEGGEPRPRSEPALFMPVRRPRGTAKDWVILITSKMIRYFIIPHSDNSRTSPPSPTPGSTCILSWRSCCAPPARPDAAAPATSGSSRGVGDDVAHDSALPRGLRVVDPRLRERLGLPDPVDPRLFRVNGAAAVTTSLRGRPRAPAATAATVSAVAPDAEAAATAATEGTVGGTGLDRPTLYSSRALASVLLRGVPDAAAVRAAATMVAADGTTTRAF
ncbi:hypothetical protein HK405_000083, partial [Cladochytrium tenue]